MTVYKVTSAYATLRVRNNLGQEVLTGFYQDAILPADVNRDDLARHIRKAMVEKVNDPAPTPATPPTDQPPAGNASREAWAAYATSKGAPEEETRPVDEGGLKQAELRARYGG